MKRFAFLFFLCASTIYSQTYYLNVWSHGNVTSIPIQEIQKIVFANTSSAARNEAVPTIIKSFKLLQNYPNPFNPGTTIEYQIPTEGVVEVKIFSVNGQLVRTFSNTYAAAGSYTVIWDGKNEAGQSVSSGLYLYQVSFSNSVIAKKMMIVK